MITKSSKYIAQYDLDRKTAKISALSSGNVSKYKFLTGKDVLRKKDLLEKAAVIKNLRNKSQLTNNLQITGNV